MSLVQTSFTHLIGHVYVAVFLLDICVLLPVAVTVGVVQEKRIKRRPWSLQVVLKPETNS